MAGSRRKEKWIIYTLAVLLCLVLASFWLMSNIYAKYSTQISGGDGARVAIFGHSQSIQLSDENGMSDMIPGRKVIYTVKVANYNGTAVSEVACNYYLEIVTTGNLPLQYTVYQQKEASDVTEIDSFLESSQNKKRKIYTSDMCFTAGNKKEDTYQITVVWPEDSNDAKYAGIPDNITVNVQVEQVD